MENRTFTYKEKVNTEKALAGFEKSGHFFFNQPLGYGYDDGINSAIQICLLINRIRKCPTLLKEYQLRINHQQWLHFVKMKKNMK